MQASCTPPHGEAPDFAPWQSRVTTHIFAEIYLTLVPAFSECSLRDCPVPGTVPGLGGGGT